MKIPKYVTRHHPPVSQRPRPQSPLYRCHKGRRYPQTNQFLCQAVNMFNMGSDSLLLLLDVSKTAALGALQVDACSQI